jgi:monofunctional biosynthetic peptidoglycan transglycosylase
VSAESSRRRGGRWGRALAALGLLAAVGAGALAAAWASLPDPSGLARRLPATSALVEQRRAEARARNRPFRLQLRPVELERISPRLAEAVVLSEDASFFGHGGFDWQEIGDAAKQNLRAGRTVRGASTITQQLAKNLWLGTERTWSRKGREALLALKLERALPKRRVLAVYLNVVEWGDGVFGAEAAARRWFGVAAADLSAAQAATLAAMLPAPRRAALSPAPPWLARRARKVLGLLRQTRKIGEDEYVAAAAELEGLLGALSPPGEADAADLEPPDDDDPPGAAPPGGAD